MIGDDGNPFIERQVQRVSLNLLLWNGIVVVGIAIVVGLLWSYLVGFFQGPKPVDDAYLLKAAQRAPRGLIAYVELSDHKLIPTGYVEQSTENDRVYSTLPYYFIDVENHRMLIKGPPVQQGHRLIGPLQGVSVKADREALDAMFARDPSMRTRVLPIMLNAASAYNVSGYILLAILTPTLLLCGFNIARSFLRSSGVHPVIRGLARQGDPTALTKGIDAEVAGNSVVRIGKAIVTENWLLRPTSFRVIACRLDDIVWTYHMVIKGDNVIGLALRDGRMFGIPLHRHAPELLQLLQQRVPWAEYGWSRETLRRWQKQRAIFLTQVAARQTAKSAVR